MSPQVPNRSIDHCANVLTSRAPSAEEQQDLAYGREVAAALAGFDIGQTVVVAGQACVAVEAMEGTDATIERAGAILRSLEAEGEPSTSGSTLDRRLSVVKVAKPKQDMRFDVPVVGLRTIELMSRLNATALAIDAYRTLLFERDQMTEKADAAGIAIQAFAPQKHNADEKSAKTRKS